MRSLCLGLLLALAVAASACAPPPGESDVGVVRLALVKDSYIFDPNITTLVKMTGRVEMSPNGTLRRMSVISTRVRI